MFNGYSKKRKSSTRPVKVNGLKNKNPNKSHVNNVEISNFNGPSTSKAVINGMLITKRAKMIHVEKKGSSSSSSSDENDYSSVKNNKMNRLTHNVQIRIKRVKPLKSDSEESRSKDALNKSETSKEVSNEDQVSHSNDSEEKNSDVDDVHIEEVSEKNSSSDSDSKIKWENVHKSDKNTVKCIHPRRRLIKDTDSENSKENLVNTQNSSTKCILKKVNGQTKSSNQIIPRKGKYPLRQVSKKNLAEVSSEGSNEEDDSQTIQKRRSNQRFVNGTKSYAEHSESDDVTSEGEQNEDIDVEETEEDNDIPRKSVNTRNSKRKNAEQDENLSEEKEEDSDSYVPKQSNHRSSKERKEDVDKNFEEEDDGDEEEEEEEDDEEEDSDNNYVPRPSVNRKNRKQGIMEEDGNFDEDSDNYVPKPSVNSRNRQQRRKVEYNDFDEEDEDSDNYVPRPTVNSRNRKRRRSSESVKRTPASSGSDQGPKRKSLRFRKAKSVNESFSDSNDSELSELKPAISISSRGRIRKLTPRARALQGVNL